MKYDRVVLEQFSKSLEEQTGLLLTELFGFKITAGNSLYHFTSHAIALQISSKQSFWASYIRSASDILEFAYPLSICRDWLCIDKRLFSFTGFPFKLFCHFNEQAQDPVARYYFVSLTEDPSSNHHCSMYGETAMKLKFSKFPSDLKDYVMLLRCKYSENPKEEIYTLLDKWKLMLDSEFDKFNLDPLYVGNEAWLYMFMRFCHMCALCIKQHAFSEEKEIRLIFVPKTEQIDSDQKYHEKRAVRPLKASSLIGREYIPLKLNALGIEATLVLNEPESSTKIYTKI